jgi:hypothetical protein
MNLTLILFPYLWAAWLAFPVQAGHILQQVIGSPSAGGAACTASDSFPGTVLSANWTTTSGSFVVASGQVSGATASAQCIAYYNAVSFSSCTNQSASMVLGTISGNFIGPGVRMGTGTNIGYDFVNNNGGSFIRYHNGGTNTNIKTCSIVSTGHTIKLTVSGTTLTAYDNGAEVGGNCHITDTNLSSGQPGIGGFNNGTSSAGTWSATSP